MFDLVERIKKYTKIAGFTALLTSASFCAGYKGIEYYNKKIYDKPIELYHEEHNLYRLPNGLYLEEYEKRYKRFLLNPFQQKNKYPKKKKGKLKPGERDA